MHDKKKSVINFFFGISLFIFVEVQKNIFRVKIRVHLTLFDVHETGNRI